MGVPLRNPDPMRAEEFFAFTATRPDDEKWELIDGEPVMNASASRFHQRIVSAIIMTLGAIEKERRPAWEVLAGIGVRVSTTSVPVPDVLVRPRDDLVGVECEDMIVAFEVLSPSTAYSDLRWKRKAYAQLPSLAHYVVLAQDEIEAVVYDRATGFAERRLQGGASTLDLPALEIFIPLSDLYFGTGLA